MSKSIGPRRRGEATPEAARPFSSAGECTPSEALGVVLEELRGTKLTDQSTSRMAELLVQFTIFLEKGHRLQRAGSISHEHVRGFVFAGITTRSGKQHPSVATMHLRRSALRLYFRTLRQLGLFEGDPTLDLELPRVHALPCGR